MWSTVTISNVLENRDYVGNMVQGHQRVKSYKIHIQERVLEEEWFIVENNHEAIIDRETFERVQGLFKHDARTAQKQKSRYLFSGFLKCADYGRAMSRIVSKGIYVYYQCGTYKSLSKRACTMHSIKSDRLEAGRVVCHTGTGTFARCLFRVCYPYQYRLAKRVNQSSWKI